MYQITIQSQQLPFRLSFDSLESVFDFFKSENYKLLNLPIKRDLIYGEIYEVVSFGRNNVRSEYYMQYVYNQKNKLFTLDPSLPF